MFINNDYWKCGIFDLFYHFIIYENFDVQFRFLFLDLKRMNLVLLALIDVIYEQRERMFHWDIQTRENNGENTSAQRECFVHCFRVFGISR